MKTKENFDFQTVHWMSWSRDKNLLWSFVVHINTSTESAQEKRVPSSVQLQASLLIYKQDYYEQEYYEQDCYEQDCY